MQQQTQATYDFDAGFEPRPHWWARVLSSLRHSCSPREIARADWTYLIFLSFVNATTIAVSLTFPLRVQNLASFTEAAFLAPAQDPEGLSHIFSHPHKLYSFPFLLQYSSKIKKQNRDATSSNKLFSE